MNIESIAEEGDDVVILGKGEWKVSNSIGLSNLYREVLEKKPNKKEYIYLSDDIDLIKDNI